MESESITLKDYLETKINNIEKAVSLAHAAMEKRLEGMNEFRDQLRDQTGTFLTREAYEAKHELLEKQVDELRLNRAMLEGKASQTSFYITLALSLIGLSFGLINLLK